MKTSPLVPLVLSGAGLLAAMAASRRSVTSSRAPTPETPSQVVPGGFAPVWLGGDTDLVLSFMALRELPPSLSHARLLEVPGQVAPGHHHPGWEWLNSYRTGEGLLPGLLAHFGIAPSSVHRLAAFGFSAGSNAGLREVLRDDQDRARLSFVAAADGLHPELNPDGSFRFFDQQVEPFLAYATDAAWSTRVLVATASNVAAPLIPGQTNAKSRDAWLKIYNSVDEYLPASVPVAESPPAFRTAVVRPEAVGGRGDFLVLLYSGRDEQAHRDQANIVAPLIASEILAPAWGAVPGVYV